MAFFDRMLDVMKLDDDDEYYDDDELYDDDDDYEEEEDTHSFFGRFGKKDEAEEEATRPIKSTVTPVKEKTSVRQTPKITPMRGGRKGSTSMEVCVIKPSGFEDAREISETLLDGRTVILNIEGLDFGLAQRIIDFTSGCCYAIDGNLQKISGYIFIVTPASVDISGDLQSIVDTFDFAGIQTGF